MIEVFPFLMFFILIEAVIQTLKMVYNPEAHKFSFDVAISLVLSVALCFVFGIDLFTYFGFAGIWQPAGYIATGIVASRGANFVHDLYKLGTGLTEKAESEIIKG